MWVSLFWFFFDISDVQKFWEFFFFFFKDRKRIRKRGFLLLAILVQIGNTLLTQTALTDIYTFTGQLLVFQKKEGRFIKEGERTK